MSKKKRRVVSRLQSLTFIECFRGRHRGGRNFTSCLRFSGPFLFVHQIGDLKITSTSTERQKRRSQNLAPVLVITSGNSLVFSRKIITSTGFYWRCAPGASAPVVVKNQSPIKMSLFYLKTCTPVTLKTPTSLNKEVRPFFLGDNSIWSFPSVSSLSDYSTWRS